MSDNSAIDCLVCRKHRGEVAVPGGLIFEDDLISISHAQLFGEEKVHYLGHVFVESKRHVPELADLTGHEAQAIGLWISPWRRPSCRPKAWNTSIRFSSATARRMSTFM